MLFYFQEASSLVEPKIMTKKRILVVDDSLTVLKALEIQLKGAGYDVSTAADGSSAVALAGEIHPDIVIVDINFPPDISQGGVGWDGFRIIEWMGLTGASGLAPAIIITSDEIEMHRDAAVAAGAVALFQKPIDYPELLETVADCLRSAPQSS